MAATASYSAGPLPRNEPYIIGAPTTLYGNEGGSRIQFREPSEGAGTASSSVESPRGSRDPYVLAPATTSSNAEASNVEASRVQSRGSTADAATMTPRISGVSEGSRSPRIQFREPFNRVYDPSIASNEVFFDEDPYEDWTKTTHERDSWANRERRRSSQWQKIDQYPSVQKTSPTDSRSRSRGSRRGSILSMFNHGLDKEGRDMLYSGDDHEDHAHDLRRSVTNSSGGSRSRESRRRRRRGSILSLFEAGKDKEGHDVIHSGFDSEEEGENEVGPRIERRKSWMDQERDRSREKEELPGMREPERRGPGAKTGAGLAETIDESIRERRLSQSVAGQRAGQILLSDNIPAR